MLIDVDDFKRINDGVAATNLGPTTLSIGVATWDAEGDSSSDQLIRAADHALYTAKRNGRDRVELLDARALVDV
jgi:diguanylate cyclase (GGDEF)-like protein